MCYMQADISAILSFSLKSDLIQYTIESNGFFNILFANDYQSYDDPKLIMSIWH